MHNQIKMIIKRVVICTLLMVLVLSSLTLPTDAAYAQADIEERAELSGTRKQLATIVFAGLAGAILGLSTLSFYGRPQDHLSNIAIGFALGVIGGASFTTYKAATQPYDAFDVTFQKPAALDLPYAEKYLVSEFRPKIAWTWEF